MDPITQLIATAAGTLFVGIVGAWVASSLSGTREHSKWVREQRIEAYREFLHVVAPMIRRVEMAAKPVRFAKEEVAALERAVDSVSLVGPQDVTGVAIDLWAAMTDGVPDDILDDGRVYLSNLLISFREEARSVVRFYDYEGWF